METISLYNNADYSDVAIKLSDGRLIRCHKIILCRSSNYFRKLCGPGSQFVESNQTEIELKDDNPESLEAVLRHIYGCPTTSQGLKSTPVWRYWLNLRVTADKYLLPKLSQSADTAFRGAANILVAAEANTIFEAIQTLRNDMSHDPSLVAYADYLQAKHRQTLLKTPAYRTWLDDDRTELWKQLDNTSFATDLVKTSVTRCLKHPQVFWSDNAAAKCGVCNPNLLTSTTPFAPTPSTVKDKACWVLKVEQAPPGGFGTFGTSVSQGATFGWPQTTASGQPSGVLFGGNVR